MPPNRRPADLVRGLGAIDATGLVVGIVIGTGVFLKTAIITQLVGRPLLVIAVWVCAGLLSLAGALTYAELGAMMPEAGGEYVFLRTAYGDGVAFQFGWIRLVVGASATAAVATSFATFLGSIAPLGESWLRFDGSALGHPIQWQFGARHLVALAIIGLVAGINSIGVTASGRTQTVLATIKVSAVLAVILGVFGWSATGAWSHFLEPAPRLVTTAGLGLPSAFGSGVVGALWAYTGWSYLPIAAGEVRDPGRNLPRAIIGGTLIVIALYVSINAAYFYALSPADIATANSTAYPNAPALATRAIATVMSGNAGRVLTVVFMISALGTVNGSMLIAPRIAFAMARDGQFFAVFARIGRRSRVPVFAIALAATLAGVLAATGTYDDLTDFTVFAYAIVYVLTAASLFVLRRRQPEMPRPYRALGYPVVPAVFLAASAWLVVNMIRTSPLVAWLALALIACGVPAYLRFKREKQKAASRE